MLFVLGCSMILRSVSLYTASTRQMHIVLYSFMIQSGNADLPSSHGGRALLSRARSTVSITLELNCRAVAITHNQSYHGGEVLKHLCYIKVHGFHLTSLLIIPVNRLS